MKTGDLVTIKPHVQPPHLYGLGLVLCDACPMGLYDKEVQAVQVMWTKLPHKQPQWLVVDRLELFCEGR